MLYPSELRGQNFIVSKTIPDRRRILSRRLRYLFGERLSSPYVSRQFSHARIRGVPPMGHLREPVQLAARHALVAEAPAAIEPERDAIDVIGSHDRVPCGRNVLPNLVEHAVGVRKGQRGHARATPWCDVRDSNPCIAGPQPTPLTTWVTSPQTLGRSTGFEPATTGATIQRSTGLSYDRHAPVLTGPATSRQPQALPVLSEPLQRGTTRRWSRPLRRRSCPLHGRRTACLLPCRRASEARCRPQHGHRGRQALAGRGP